MKLFYNKKINDFTKELCIFGFKLKFTNHKKEFKRKLPQCESMINNIMKGPHFIYTNANNFSTRDFKIYMSDVFYRALGYFPDLENPKTFNEKINWLKYNYFNPLENICADKYTAKGYFAQKAGEEYVIPLLGVWDNVNDIDFSKLPEKVVFKNTISGGTSGVKIIDNLSKLNKDELKYSLNKLLFNTNNDTYCSCIVPERRLIKERIIAEKYIEEMDGHLFDYKFFCFNGKMEFLYVGLDAMGELDNKLVFLDRNWNILDLKHGAHPILNKEEIKKPENFEKMIEISETFAQDFPFVRVDLYNINGKIYCGELTFNPTGGCMNFHSKEIDLKIGQMLDLDKIDKKFITDDIVKSIKSCNI